MVRLSKVRCVQFIMTLGFVSGCTVDDSDIQGCVENPSPETQFYSFVTVDQQSFIAWTSDMEVIDEVAEELRLPLGKRTKSISGPITFDEEACDYNGNWNWYFSPNKWELTSDPGKSCRVTLNEVQRNWRLYLDRFCPPNARVEKEIEKPF